MSRERSDSQGSLGPDDEVMPYSDDETDDELDPGSDEEGPPGGPQPEEIKSTESGWSVKANDRAFCNLPEFQKKYLLCLKKSKYAVSHLSPGSSIRNHIIPPLAADSDMGRVH
ncbi:unnamed protein product [Oncorhynchus mykiss]|uniref:Uncharacterized protein n=1 Tax=Oncorhynchus mykiss TaxID=8022 RepID=A0A060Z1A0_ONCMY|nr:unnamed protein product [Oncorhynchus mykiss]